MSSRADWTSIARVSITTVGGSHRAVAIPKTLGAGARPFANSDTNLQPPVPSRSATASGRSLDGSVSRPIICIMTQVRTRRTMSPKQAAACCRPVDSLLDPELFKALCDPTRAKLLGCLIKCGRPCSVSEVAECCSVDFSVVSRHLALLDRAGVLAATKDGRTVFYSVQYEELCQKLRKLADAVEECAPTARAASKGACCGNG